MVKFSNPLASLSSSIIRGSLSSFLVRIGGFILGFCFVLLLTRNLGVSVMGNYAITFTVLNLLSIFSRLGLDTSTLRFISQFYSFGKVRISGGVYIQSFVIISLTSIVISALSISALSFQGIYPIDEVLEEYFLIGCWAIPGMSINALNAQVFRAMKEPALFTFFKFNFLQLLNILLLSFCIYVLFLDVNPILVLLISVYVSLIVSTTLLFINLKLINHRVWVRKHNSFFSRKIIKTGIPMLFTDSTTFLMSWIDILMLGYFCSSEEVGVYNVAMKISSFTGVTLFAVNSISAPKFSQYFNGGYIEKFKKAVAESTSLIFLSTFPLVLFILLFSNQIINAFIGDDSTYLVDLGSHLVIILGVGQLVSALSGSVGNIMNMTGKQAAFRNVILLTLVVKIFLNLVLISSLGVAGAAYSSALGTIFWNLICVLLIYKFYRIYTIYIPKLK